MDALWDMRGAEQLWLGFAVVLGADRFQLSEKLAAGLLGMELVPPVPLSLVCCTAGTVVQEKKVKQ